MKFKKMFNKYKLIIVLVLLSCPLFFLVKSYATDNENYKPKITIDSDGNVTIVITAKAATTNIRYRSIGFTVTTKPSPETAYAKGEKGPSAPLSPYGELDLDVAKIDEIYRDKNIVQTQYIFNKNYVKDNIMKNIIDLDNISQVTYLYFHVIFQTYYIDKNGNETILNPKITTWQGIVNDQPWANIDVFKQYFNIKIPYEPGPQDNTIHYIVEGTQVGTKELDKIKIGQYLTWKSYVTPTYNFNGNTYSLVEYYVRAKEDKKNDPDRIRKKVGDKINGKTITAEDIINDSVKVIYGGMDVYMIYKQTDATVKIHAADIDTDKIIKENIYVGKIKPGENFSQSIDKAITIGKDTYTKTKHFYYYLKNNPAKMRVRETAKDEDPIEFTAFSDIDSNDEIIVIAYYKKASQGTIAITVNAVNKETGAKITTLATETAKSGDTYKYTAQETLSAGGKSYDFTGEWKWEYRKNTSSSPIVSNSGKGENISFTVPSANDISGGITVTVYYTLGEASADQIDLRVIMVTMSGSLIEEVSKETVTRGQSISKSIQNQRLVGNITYQYQNKWDYTYKTSSGDQTKTGTGNTVSFKVPNETQLGTVITVKIYYDASQNVDVPDPLQPIILPIDTPDPYAIIDGDKYGSQYFISREGIATTESQHVYVKTKDYLLGYRLVNKTGKLKLSVPVTMTYTLIYNTATPEEFGGPKEVTETVTDTQYISVERAYSYWEIEYLEYYTPSSATVYNYSLPNERANLVINSAYLFVPALSTRHSSNLYDHIILPRQVTEGIHLNYDTPITSDDGYRPTVNFIDLTPYALEMTEELKVKNDFIMFDGVVVMSDEISEKIAPVPYTGVMVHSNSLTHDKALFKDGLVIDALKKNGVYTSSGNVIYQKHPMSVNAYSSKTFNIKVNDVTIHTPVICDPIIYADNDKWVQLIEPQEEAYHLVLDPDSELNDFTVRISNKLHHTPRLGYYERDFSRSFIDPENISYIAKKNGKLRNEMRLPFDVFIDINNDNKTENDELIKAGTWIILDRETYRFYVPMWVQEGIYTAEFRTIAVNGEDKLSNTENVRNTNISNYVATATRTFQISGRIYGFTVYDISDEGRWKDIFRKKDTMLIKLFEGAIDGTKRPGFNKDYAYYYTVGTKNQYGMETGRYSKYTLPLINGSHPKYKNVGAIKTGYAFRFMIDTTGEMYSSGCRIRIIPTFYHVDENGKNRQLVDIYYDEEINGKLHQLIKIGEGIDLVNLKQGQVGNPYSRIPEDELKHTAKVMDTTYSKIKNQYGFMYSYSEIRLTNQFRTFIGLDYANHITGLPSYNKVKEVTKETELSLSKYMQRWYGTYKLPTNIHVAPAGFDVYGYLKKYGIDYREDFWLKEGYIIVNFSIETINKNGNRHLSYINSSNYLNKGHCSMWVTEGAVIQKKDDKGAAFDFKAGDVILYYVNKNYKEDFIGVLY